MGDDEKIEFIVRTFSRVIAHEKQRMALGMAVRNYMHHQLELGQQVDHYRSEWLHSSIVRVIHLLDEIGHEFNKQHPEDKCSQADLLDIASSVTATLQNGLSSDD